MIRVRETNGALESMTRKDLLAIAKARGLRGYSRLKKAELVTLLSADEPAATTRRRVALVAWEGDPRAPGGEAGREVAGLALSLSDAGCDVHLFVREDGTSLDGETAVRVGRITAGGDDILDAAEVFGTEAFERIRDEEERNGPFDVLHVLDWIGAEAVRDVDRPYILSLHSIETVRTYGWPGPLSPQIEAREREAVQGAIRVLVADEDLRRAVIQRYGADEDRVRVLKGPFPEERFAAEMDDPGRIKARYHVGPVDPMALFIGPLDEDHGADVLLEAVPEILAAEPQARFVFVGDGALREALHARARELGIDAAVRILGHREGQEVEDIVRASDLLVVPSRGATSDGPLLCAWSAARPVVVTDEGPSAEVRDRENGLRARAEPEAVATGVRRILEDWEEARRLGEAGRETLRERHGPGAWAGRVLEAYRV
jgi:glycosyltransferase involved in cell wall biosynthesis